MIQDNKKGFTLVELTLSLTFISILLLSIAMTIIQVSGQYNRGLTMKAVTLAGSNIATDLQKSVSSTMPFSIDNGSAQYYADAYGGRLCLDRYSYIWNYGKAINDGTSQNKFASGSDVIRFVKVPDVGAIYCLDNKRVIDSADAVDLLSSGDRNLSIHAFSITSDKEATEGVLPSTYDKISGSRIYTISYTIGTNDAFALTDDYTACKQPGVNGADLNYCSVESFAISATAGNLYQN